MTTKADILAALMVERYLPIPKAPDNACSSGPTRQWSVVQAVDEYVDNEDDPPETLASMSDSPGTKACGQLFPYLTVAPNVEVTTTTEVA